MWIQVRSMDGRIKTRVDGLSKLTKVQELRRKLTDKFQAPPERQRLFYRGKQLEDGYTLYDYDVGLNDIIQILIRPVLAEQSINDRSSDCKDELDPSSSGDESVGSNKENKQASTTNENAAIDMIEPSLCNAHSLYYRVGDIVDARDSSTGSWFEAKIVRINKEPSTVTEICYDGDFAAIQRETASRLEPKELRHGEEHVSDNENQIQNNMTEGPDEEHDQKTDNLEHQEAEKNGSTPLDSCVYHIVCESHALGEGGEEAVEKKLQDIRPRAHKLVSFAELEEGTTVMVNYNIDDPSERGLWYDAVIMEKRDKRTSKEIEAVVFVGPDSLPLEKCRIPFVNEVYKVEETVELSQRTPEMDSMMIHGSTIQRKYKAECRHCGDHPDKKCKHCACCICGGKDEPNKQIMCDECDIAYHIWCLDPPLAAVPDTEEWYCPECKNDTSEVVKAGEKLKESKKKARLPGTLNISGRDWGKGMACVGRTTECTIVPPNHFGPVPGTEVGLMWKFRMQVSEVGVHRPHVAGIHGRETEGAYSIVLSGGYEDDVTQDKGDEFTYTGSGGRDLSGNKRTAEQSCNQTLTRMNKALALNCAAAINNKTGAEAKDWKSGKPVRVVRNCKGRKHSQYCPEEGNRYDGIYKVVKYWPEKGKSGFLVWRYLLRRDDPTPAPWTKAGQQRIKSLGFTMQYPEGYLESQEGLKEVTSIVKKEVESPKNKGKGKRSLKEVAIPTLLNMAKKAKNAQYEVPQDLAKLIKGDTQNKKVWRDCLSASQDGKQAFLKKVEEVFLCICCQEVVFQPVTTKCSHIFCKPCLQRSFQAEVFNCPTCRHNLGKDYVMTVNQDLSDILRQLFPGYEVGR